MRTRPIDPQKRDDERSIGTVTLALEQLAAWMQSDEDEYLEFKEAKGGFHFEKLVKYCAALANEGGGRIILGGKNTGRDSSSSGTRSGTRSISATTRLCCSSTSGTTRPREAHFVSF